MEGELNELALRFRWFAGNAAASSLYQRFARKLRRTEAGIVWCRRGSVSTAMDPNLKPFFSRGGKIIRTSRLS
jgi:hypothetical protein